MLPGYHRPKELQCYEFKRFQYHPGDHKASARQAVTPDRATTKLAESTVPNALHHHYVPNSYTIRSVPVGDHDREDPAAKPQHPA